MVEYRDSQRQNSPFMRQDSRAFMGLPFVSHDLDSSHALLCQEQKNKATAKRTKGGGRQKARAKLLRRGRIYLRCCFEAAVDPPRHCCFRCLNPQRCCCCCNCQGKRKLSLQLLFLRIKKSNANNSSLTNIQHQILNFNPIHVARIL